MAQDGSVDGIGCTGLVPVLLLDHTYLHFLYDFQFVMLFLEVFNLLLATWA
jgi:hypothetical protein